jgi:hypothetical protein
VLVARLGGRREQELAGHLEVENEGPAAFELDEQHLAAAPNAENAVPLQGGQPLGAGPAQQGRCRSSTAATTRPRRRGASPRAMVSTSGSSGIKPFYQRRSNLHIFYEHGRKPKMRAYPRIFNKWRFDPFLIFD